MDTWILVADEHHAALLVQSSTGALHEIESWDCDSGSREEQMQFASEIAKRIDALQTDFDSLVVAAPPRFLEDLSAAFGDTVNGKVAAELARDLTRLNCKELRSELKGVMLVGAA